MNRQLKRMPLTGVSRVRVFDPDGEPIADTALLKDEIERKDLPPIRKPSAIEEAWLNFVRSANRAFENINIASSRMAEARTLEEEVAIALQGMKSIRNALTTTPNASCR
ncbi:MAG: hypothetical protein HC871_10800 [Rhizobiales bacterium]|nr:hypothetical protein [Hyphomicrobiales bacterium]